MAELRNTGNPPLTEPRWWFRLYRPDEWVVLGIAGLAAIGLVVLHYA